MFFPEDGGAWVLCFLGGTMLLGEACRVEQRKGETLLRNLFVVSTDVIGIPTQQGLAVSRAAQVEILDVAYGLAPSAQCTMRVPNGSCVYQLVADLPDKVRSELRRRVDGARQAARVKESGIIAASG